MLNLKKSFTIIELIIFMGVLSILLFVLTDVFISSLDVKSQSQSQAGLQQDGRYILAKLIYDINRGSAISDPAIGIESNSLTIVINGENQTYSLINGILRLTNNLGNFNLNSFQTQVSDLKFLHLGNPVTVERPNPKDNIRISFSLTSNKIINSGQEVVSYQTTAGLR